MFLHQPDYTQKVHGFKTFDINEDYELSILKKLFEVCSTNETAGLEAVLEEANQNTKFVNFSKHDSKLFRVSVPRYSPPACRPS